MSKYYKNVQVNRPGYKPFERKMLVGSNEEKSAKEKRLIKSKLPNIPMAEANHSSDILDLGTRKRYRFASDIKMVRVFAGKGSNVKFRDAEKWASKLGGKAEDYAHCLGFAYITDGKSKSWEELHWVQRQQGRPLKVFIKVREKKK